MTAERLGDRPHQHWLIGGYGMGFTLRAALEVLPADAKVTVAELVPEIVAWAEAPMAALTGTSLQDPRVRIHLGDVAEVIAATSAGFDAILLDVDNGPDALVRPENDALYSPAGLARTRAALRPGGLLSIWSAAPDPRFSRTLAAAGFTVEEEVARARANGKGPRHHIWFAKAR
jgi:spermidine synthase